MTATENINCLKNFMQLVCCDGTIHPNEKAFLYTAAKEMAVTVDDWGALLKEVLKDDIPFYPIADRDKAIAALKAMIVLAKADGQVDEREKKMALQFAKSIGVSKREWKEIVGVRDTDDLFKPFSQSGGHIVAIKDDFEKFDDFLKTAQDHRVKVQAIDLKSHLESSPAEKAAVCFHAAPEKDASIARCEVLLNKTAGSGLVCILNRYQGHQVKYLHEVGLRTCVIEPVYSRDIAEILTQTD